MAPRDGEKRQYTVLPYRALAVRGAIIALHGNEKTLQKLVVYYLFSFTIIIEENGNSKAEKVNFAQVCV